MRLDLQKTRISDEPMNHAEPWRPPSPDKSLARTPQRTNPPPVRPLFTIVVAADTDVRRPRRRNNG